jgi:hypothetical protein
LKQNNPKKSQVYRFNVLVRLPGFAWNFIVSSVSLSLCLYVSLSLYLSLSLPSISPKHKLTLNLPT